MDRDLTDRVIVLTGASTGIGRETALEFARSGARVVVAARNQKALDDLTGEIERLGGQALAVTTDVSDFDQVVDLAAQAAQRFGRIDIWVNNASVSTYGTVEQMDVEEIRRVIEVNLLGQIHGMKAALPHLRQTGGTIINVSSTLGKRAVPLQAAYCAAKHGVVAFGEALRLELRHDDVPVTVVDILPSSINTPLFEHARSKIGVAAQADPADLRTQSRCRGDRGGRPDGPSGRCTPDLPATPWRPPSGSARRSSTGICLGRVESWTTSAPTSPTMAATTFTNPCDEPGRTTGQFGHQSKSTSVYTRWFGLHPARARAALGLSLAAGVAALRSAGRRR